jgi:hypothetical protein
MVWPVAKIQEPKFMHKYGYYECSCKLQANASLESPRTVSTYLAWNELPRNISIPSTARSRGGSAGQFRSVNSLF